MTYQPVRLDGLLAKIETGGYGVDSVPVVGTDGVRVSDRLWPNLRYRPRWPGDRLGAANNKIWPASPAIPRGRVVELTIFWEMRGAGSDAVVEADPLVRSCGWTQADGASVFTYTLAAENHESCSIYAYAGGLLWKVVGCRGTLSWPWVPGAHGSMRFEMQGLLSAEPATSAVGTITSYDATVPIAFVNTGLTVGAVTPKIISGEFNQGSNPAWTEDVNGSDGLGEFDWSEAQPSFTMTCRKLALATYDPWADEKAQTPRAIAATLGSAQFNRFTLSLPETYVEAPDHGASDGFTDYVLRYRVAGDSALPVISST